MTAESAPGTTLTKRIAAMPSVRGVACIHVICPKRECGCVRRKTGVGSQRGSLVGETACTTTDEVSRPLRSVKRQQPTDGIVSCDGNCFPGTARSRCAKAMGQDDAGTPLHRDMGVHVVRGVEPWRIFAQYMGRSDGPTRGKDGNVHMADSKLGLLAMVSHLPAMLPVAVGCALAFRIRQERRVAVGWFGEGASARGDAHEAMTFAGTRRLPIVFVCDNNQWAYSTPTHLEYATEHVADRADAYGFEGVVVDGTDVLAVYREVKRAIETARAGGGPTLIESVTLRMEGHAVHDDAFYVPKEMFERWAENDPIERFRTWLQEHAGLTGDEEDAISDGLREEMRRDKRVFVIGEDVGVYGGAFKVTLGFQEEFGAWRVIDAPLSGTAIVGSCTGAPIMGLRPVAEMQFAGFISCAR